MSDQTHFQSDRKLKFVRKFMKIARVVAEDNNTCFSRQIGVVIADVDNKIIAMGYNGPPAKTPHCDQYDYLTNFFIPQLTDDELYMLNLKGKYELNNITAQDHDQWAREHHDCKTCPRRFVNAGPGERSTLCSCQHAERNAITNTAASMVDCSMYCWCGVPCIDCAGAIVNAGITECHVIINGPDYHPVSRWILQKGGVELYEYEASYFLPEPMCGVPNTVVKNT